MSGEQVFISLVIRIHISPVISRGSFQRPIRRWTWRWGGWRKGLSLASEPAPSWPRRKPFGLKILLLDAESHSKLRGFCDKLLQTFNLKVPFPSFPNNVRHSFSLQIFIKNSQTLSNIALSPDHMHLPLPTSHPTSKPHTPYKYSPSSPHTITPLLPTSYRSPLHSSNSLSNPRDSSPGCSTSLEPPLWKPLPGKQLLRGCWIGRWFPA